MSPGLLQVLEDFRQAYVADVVNKPGGVRERFAAAGGFGVSVPFTSMYVIARRPVA